MTGSARRRFTPIAILVSLALALLLFATTGVSQAQAADYTLEDFTGCSQEDAAAPGDNSVYDSAGGSWDENGNLYIACSKDNRILVLDASGAVTKTIGLGFMPSDIAPSPSGDRLYVARGNSPVKSLKRATDGTYAVDANWELANYNSPIDNASTAPLGVFISTDASGFIYLADGGFSQRANGDINTIVKYRADGTLVTSFGSKVKDSWNNGVFNHTLTGVVASRDGSRVYTAENGNNRVQRWDRQVDGTYAYHSKFGGTAANDPNRWGGDCTYDTAQNPFDDTFGAPYELGLDDAGYIYVTNASCRSVQRFTDNNNGTYTLDYNSPQFKRADGKFVKPPHGIAVAKNGSIYVGQAGKKLTLPKPQGVDMELTSITDTPDPVGVDNNVTYTVNTTNKSNTSTARDPMVRMRFPTDMNFVSTDPNDGQCRNFGIVDGKNEVRCYVIGGGSANAQGTVSVTVTPTTSGTKTFVANVELSTLDTDSVSTNNSRSEGTTVSGTGVTCHGSAPDITGTDNGETLSGTDNKDVIDARGGNDTIQSLDNLDVACGGAGYDTFKVERFGGQNTLDGGNDTVPDDDSDIVDYSAMSQAGVDIELDRSWLGSDVGYAYSGGPDTGATFMEQALYNISDVEGSEYKDWITGSKLSNSLYGKGGDDTITGNEGRDYIDGGAGADTIKARDGEVDTILCGAGTDEVEADANDTVAADCESVDRGTDATAPTGSLLINKGAIKTRSRTVNLKLHATDNAGGNGIAEMCVSNSASSCTAWEPYAASKTWKLAGRTTGVKTVYVRYKDEAGNVSVAFKDTIKYIQ